MWSGPLHDPEFVSDVLDHVEANEDKYGTAARMKGMLTVAKEVSGTSTRRFGAPLIATVGTRRAFLFHTVKDLESLPLCLSQPGRDSVSASCLVVN